MSSATEGQKWVVIRNDNGLPTNRIEKLTNQTQTWRAVLRAMTNDGKLLAKMVDISRGKPFVVELTDGRQLAPVVPSLDTQADATKYLLDRLYGKSVVETEVVAAEEQSRQVEALRALSDEELETAARKTLEARLVKDE